MLFGFLRSFHEFVQGGTKTHTIRARSKRRSPKPGDIADCYGDSRQKSMFLLGRWPITRVQEIKIVFDLARAGFLLVFIDGALLSDAEANALFYRDGFRFSSGEQYPAMAQARAFWEDRLPFSGDLIHWDFDKPVERKKGKKRGS